MQQDIFLSKEDLMCNVTNPKACRIYRIKNETYQMLMDTHTKKFHQNVNDSKN